MCGYFDTATQEWPSIYAGLGFNVSSSVQELFGYAGHNHLLTINDLNVSENSENNPLLRYFIFDCSSYFPLIC